MKKGGVEATFCNCGYGSLGCYGKVQCDCSDPINPKCPPSGMVISKSKLNKNINKIRKTRCRKNYLVDQMKNKKVKRIVLDQPMHTIFIKKNKKFKKMEKHNSLEAALKAATLKKTLPDIKTIKEGLYELKRYLKTDSKAYYVVWL